MESRSSPGMLFLHLGHRLLNVVFSELEDEMMEQFIRPEYLPRLRMAVGFLNMEHSDLCRVSLGEAGWENELASSSVSAADDGNRSALNGRVGSLPADPIDTGIV